MERPKHVLITGASSGIGEALALAYAAPGIRLALGARDEGRLAAVAAACRAKGAEAVTHRVDVTDAAAMEAWIAAADQVLPLELVVANAGISRSGSGGETLEQTKEVFAVNWEGVLHTVHPAIRLMRARGRGQIALMSSLAAFRGYSTAPAYCASKAAVKGLGEGLRSLLAPSGIEVSVICPGFVRSRMTARNKFPMPFLMDADRAASIIKRGLARNRPRIAFPWRLYALLWLVGVLPALWTDKLDRPRKSETAPA